MTDTPESVRVGPSRSKSVRVGTSRSESVGVNVGTDPLFLMRCEGSFAGPRQRAGGCGFKINEPAYQYMCVFLSIYFKIRTEEYAHICAIYTYLYDGVRIIY